MQARQRLYWFGTWFYEQWGGSRFKVRGFTRPSGFHFDILRNIFIWHCIKLVFKIKYWNNFVRLISGFNNFKCLFGYQSGCDGSTDLGNHNLIKKKLNNDFASIITEFANGLEPCPVAFYEGHLCPAVDSQRLMTIDWIDPTNAAAGK